MTKNIYKKCNDFVSDIHLDSINESLLPSKAQGRRRCGLCAEKGHYQYSCRRIKFDFGSFVVRYGVGNIMYSI